MSQMLVNHVNPTTEIQDRFILLTYWKSTRKYLTSTLQKHSIINVCNCNSGRWTRKHLIFLMPHVLVNKDVFWVGFIAFCPPFVGKPFFNHLPLSELAGPHIWPQAGVCVSREAAAEQMSQRLQPTGFHRHPRDTYITAQHLVLGQDGALQFELGAVASQCFQRCFYTILSCFRTMNEHKNYYSFLFTKEMATGILS